MQRINGNGAVRIGIYPGAGLRGVVNGQDLHHLLSAVSGPLHILQQIAEIADAGAALRSQTEDRNGAAGKAHGFILIDNALRQQHGAAVLCGQFSALIAAGLPIDGAGVLILDEELILKYRRQFRPRQGQCKIVRALRGNSCRLLQIPAA